VIFFYPIHKDRHSLFGFVDVDKDCRASLFRSRIGLRLRASGLGFGFRGRRIGLRAWRSCIGVSFLGLPD